MASDLVVTIGQRAFHVHQYPLYALLAFHVHQYPLYALLAFHVHQYPLYTLLAFHVHQYPLYALLAVIPSAAAAAGEGTGPLQAGLSFLPGGALSLVPIACYCYARPCRLSPHSVLLVRSTGNGGNAAVGGCGSGWGNAAVGGGMQEWGDAGVGGCGGSGGMRREWGDAGVGGCGGSGGMREWGDAGVGGCGSGGMREWGDAGVGGCGSGGMREWGDAGVGGCGSGGMREWGDGEPGVQEMTFFLLLHTRSPPSTPHPSHPPSLFSPRPSHPSLFPPPTLFSPHTPLPPSPPPPLAASPPRRLPPSPPPPLAAFPPRLLPLAASLLEMSACGPSHSLPLPLLASQRLQHLLLHWPPSSALCLPQPEGFSPPLSPHTSRALGGSTFLPDLAVTTQGTQPPLTVVLVVVAGAAVAHHEVALLVEAGKEGVSPRLFVLPLRASELGKTCSTRS
ncbi:unnamed protein product [Closterium sp. Naga37s-1]|nr:unnamed protein product [Closterium sp. Naga37s-1]